MTTIEIKDASGKKAGDAELSASVFGIEPNVPVMHQVVRAQRASWRAGTSNTLTRGQVRGGGKKPWRQKGTGRARQGSIRSPQWAGGGTVFGPHPRSYAFRVNNKEVKLAMRSALSAKLADGQFTVVDELQLREALHEGRQGVHQGHGLRGPAHPRWSSATTTSPRGCPSATWRRSTFCPSPRPTPTSCSTTSSWCSPPRP